MESLPKKCLDVLVLLAAFTVAAITFLCSLE